MLNTFKFIPLSHLSLLLFSGSFVSPYFLPPHHPQPFIIRIHSFTPAPHLLSRCKAPPTWTPPAPATRQPPPLVPEPRVVCLRLPPVPVPVRSPLCCPRPAPMSLSDPGGLARHGSLCASVSLPLTPRFLLRILTSSGPWFLVRWLFARGREAKLPPLPGSCAPWSSLPPLLGHSGDVQSTPPPPPFPPLPPHLVSVIQYPLVEEVWGVALDFGVSRAGRCHGRGFLVRKTEGQIFVFVFCVVSNIWFGVDGNARSIRKNNPYMATNCKKGKAMEQSWGDFLCPYMILTTGEESDRSLLEQG